jgi:NADH dehydrogenase
MATITVFGGTGFLGRHIVWSLAKTGAAIRIATRRRDRAYFLRPAGTVGQVVPWACDVNDDASVAAALHGADIAINLTGTLKPSGKTTFQSLHVAAAERIAKAAKDLDLFIHVSAEGLSPSAPSAYARSKAEGEARVRAACPGAVILRPSLVFGPEDNFFNMFAAIAQMSPVLPLVGGGRTRVQPVYVGDVAKAVHKLVADPEPAKYQGRVYELAGPQAYTIRELVETMKAATHQTACLVSVPVPLAKLMGCVTGLFPGRLPTVDQVRMLESDWLPDPELPGLKDLGIAPATVESVLPAYLALYRPGGRFAEKRQAS